jgi:hypothetical protein
MKYSILIEVVGSEKDIDKFIDSATNFNIGSIYDVSKNADSIYNDLNLWGDYGWIYLSNIIDEIESSKINISLLNNRFSYDFFYPKLKEVLDFLNIEKTDKELFEENKEGLMNYLQTDSMFNIFVDTLSLYFIIINKSINFLDGNELGTSIKSEHPYLWNRTSEKFSFGITSRTISDSTINRYLVSLKKEDTLQESTLYDEEILTSDSYWRLLSKRFPSLKFKVSLNTHNMYIDEINFDYYKRFWVYDNGSCNNYVSKVV